VAAIVDVAVIVIAPLIVAALVNGNDIVDVIDAVNDHDRRAKVADKPACATSRSST
jgi:hypothetical protein